MHRSVEIYFMIHRRIPRNDAAMTFEEIGRRLNMTTGAVVQMYHYSIKKLKKDRLAVAMLHRLRREIQK